MLETLHSARTLWSGTKQAPEASPFLRGISLPDCFEAGIVGYRDMPVSIDAAEAEALYKTSLQRCWMPSMGSGLNPQP